MPHEGWRPLFFTGGSGVKELAMELARRHVASVHIVSTFDSGGSSAELRKSFAMPAVGDLRNRLLALADRSSVEASVLDLVSKRLPKDISRQKAQYLLEELAANHALWGGMSQGMAIPLRHSLYAFLDRMPKSFDARGASIGNLLLAGSFLENGRDFGPALAFFSSLLKIQGVILPVAQQSLHLGAYLHNGQSMIGQHLFHAPPDIIDKIFLTVSLERGRGKPVSCRPQPYPGVVEEILRAHLICLPMGSFFSSLLPNLLLAQIGKSIVQSQAPTVYIPNSGNDVELKGTDLIAQVKHILALVSADLCPVKSVKLLDYVLVDKKNGSYQIQDWAAIEESLDKMGIKLVDRAIVDSANPQRHLADRLVDALWELTRASRN